MESMDPEAVRSPEKPMAFGMPKLLISFPHWNHWNLSSMSGVQNKLPMENLLACHSGILSQDSSWNHLKCRTTATERGLKSCGVGPKLHLFFWGKYEDMQNLNIS